MKRKVLSILILILKLGLLCSTFLYLNDPLGEVFHPLEMGHVLTMGYIMDNGYQLKISLMIGFLVLISILTSIRLFKSFSFTNLISLFLSVFWLGVLVSDLRRALDNLDGIYMLMTHQPFHTTVSNIPLWILYGLVLLLLEIIIIFNEGYKKSQV